jgi:hypothetical protein
MTSEAKEPKEKLSPIVVAALIGLVGTIIAALLVSPLLSRGGDGPNDNPTVIVPAVSIDGPTTAPLGQQTYFTLLSENAVRAEWSIGGFTDGPVVVDPLPPSHEIFVEPTNAARVGNSFTIAVTVYSADGQTAQATRQFLVVAE